MYRHLILEDTMDLNDIGRVILKLYPNIRFLFEIDFTKDDYLYIKNLFNSHSGLSKDIISKDYVQRYFRNYSLHRIPFLILIAGFIRYEYLNSENSSNFFSNFVKNILKNDLSTVNDFRQELIDHFFKWRGNKIFEYEGLYIYETQTQGVSLKLEDAGHHKYLNSLILHSGGISEKDLQEYRNILGSLIELMADTHSLHDAILHINIHSNRLKNFFTLLSLDNEVSKFVEHIIHMSIHCIDRRISIPDLGISFELPLYLKNYLRFTGKYGDELGAYRIDVNDLFFKKGKFYFRPEYIDTFTNVEKVAFIINEEVFELEKEYTKENFLQIEFPIYKFMEPISIQLVIDGELFERYSIDLFCNDFVLLDHEHKVRQTSSDTINIANKNEREGDMYILSCLDIKLPVQDEYMVDDKKMFLYRMMINRLRKGIEMDHRYIKLYFPPILLSEFVFKNDKGYEYYDELPKFDIRDEKDMEKFKAKDLLNNVYMTYEEYLAYPYDIGKFKIELLNRSYDFIYIKGLEFLEWPEWYNNKRSAKISIDSSIIDSNYTSYEEKRMGTIFTYDLEDMNSIWFKIDDERYVEIEIKRPMVNIELVDNKGRRTRVTKRNINIERLVFFKNINVQLFNYPAKINFNSVQINDKFFPVKKVDNEYIIPIMDIMTICTKDDLNCLIRLRQHHLYQNLFHLVRVNSIDTEDDTIVPRTIKEIVKVNSLDFIKENMGDVKYYILINNKRKPFFVSRIIREDIGGYVVDLIEFHEVRQTNRNTVIKKPFKTILNDGVYVEADAVI